MSLPYRPVPVPRQSIGWYYIPGFSGYAANRQGEILNLATNYATKGGNAGRYLKVAVRRDGDTVTTLQHVHDLVCRTFQGPPEPGQVVLHGNDQRWDNRALNLSWGSQSQNVKDTYVRGIRQPTYGPRTVVHPVSLEAFYLEEDDFVRLLQEPRAYPLRHLVTGIGVEDSDQEVPTIVVAQEEDQSPTLLAGSEWVEKAKVLGQEQVVARQFPFSALFPYMVQAVNPQARRVVCPPPQW